MTATSFLSAVGRAPIRIGTLDGENTAFPKIFALSSGTEFSNLSLDRVSLGVGSQTGSIFDANTTTTTKQGSSSDPIRTNNDAASGATGYTISGYTVTLGTTYVDVSSGTALINGQSVGSTKNSGVAQRLYPDLSGAAAWNVKLSPAGTPYIEKQSAVRTESAYAPTIATFTTAGGGAGPAGLVSNPFNNQRLHGTLDLPKSVNTFLRREMSGWVACPTTVATSMFTLSLSPTAGQDDSIVAHVQFVATIGAGANRSVWIGQFTCAFAQDNSPNRTNVTSAIFGDAKTLDANVATWTLTFAQTVAGNVSTIKATSTPSTGETIALEFTVTVRGGGQTSTTASLAAGVTAAA